MTQAEIRKLDKQLASRLEAIRRGHQSSHAEIDDSLSRFLQSLGFEWASAVYDSLRKRCA
jgi:hypothetical protein